MNTVKLHKQLTAKCGRIGLVRCFIIFLFGFGCSSVFAQQQPVSAAMSAEKHTIETQTMQRYGEIEVRENAETVTIDNGELQIHASKLSGLANYAWHNVTKIHNSYSSVQLQNLLSTNDYPKHSVGPANISQINDGFGSGIKVSLIHTSVGKPTLIQHYTVYEKIPYFFIQVEMQSEQGISSNWMAPVVVDNSGGVDIGSYADNHALFVPWDNDHFIRFRADPMNGAGTSYETTAFYDNTSRNGLVVGSVSHDTWKTGISYAGANNKLHSLKIYGGANSDITQDPMPHGHVSGTSILSPMMFIGFYDDWRTGMEAFAQANAIITPPLTWQGSAPIGWNSWAAYECNITPSAMKGVSDFIKNNLQEKGYNNNGEVYVNWDSACGPGPLAYGEEYAEVAQHIKDNGQHPGIYFSTFAVWDWADDVESFVPGTNNTYRWKDIFLRDANDTPIKFDGGRALDPTHPGTKMYVENVLNNFKRWGYEFVKLDFLSHGAVEGKHHLANMTAMQAYHYGMQYIQDAIGDDMFVSLSIAPLFPGAEYAHSRRISCDAFGGIKDTEYMLNSVTYGWWLDKYYLYNDGDHVVVGSNSVNEAQSRASASAIAGLFLNSDKLAEDPMAQARARDFLGPSDVIELAKQARTFLPVEGNTASQAADTFVLLHQNQYYLAVFNYDAKPTIKHIDLQRAGFNKTTEYLVTDLWSEQKSTATGSIDVALEGEQGTILRLQTK